MELSVAMLDMIQNVALIISLAMIYRVLMARVKLYTILIQILIGLLFGGFSVVAMETPFHLMPGIIFDGRSIILSLAGLFCGPITTLVAALIAAGYRVWLGGGGALVGVSVILESSLIGILFHYLRHVKKIQLKSLTLLIMGGIVHILMLLIMLALPDGAGMRAWREIGVYILLFFTLATLVIGLLFLDSENQLLDRKALEKSEKTLRKAQELSHVGNWVWRRADNNLEGSDELYRIYGLNKETFSGNLAEAMFDRIHPDDAEKEKLAWETMLTGALPAHIEFRIIRDDGDVRVVWAETGEVSLDNKGQGFIASGILQDITERREFEKELLENETRYRSLIMNSPDAILVNHHDRILLVNNRAIELFGASQASDLIGKTVWELFHPDYHDQIKQRIRLMREKNEPVAVAQEQIIRLDGRVVDVDAVAAPFTLHGHNDIHVILRDITERKRMEDELRDSHDLLARLADQVPGAVFQFCFQPDGKKFFPFTSPAMANTFGLSPEELCEDAGPVLDCIQPDDRARIAKELAESAQALHVFNTDFRVHTKEKGIRWYQCNAQPESTKEGGTLWSGILSDITDRKMDERKIAEQLGELRRWQSVMLGREKRTIELKQEVNALLKELGQPPRYAAPRVKTSDPSANLTIVEDGKGG